MIARALAALAVLGCLTAGSVSGQERAANPHGDVTAECATCHGAEGWRPARISRGFDHGSTGFALAGAHARTPCGTCHLSLEFRKVETACAGCHKDVHQGELGASCAQCHSTRSFLDRSSMVQAHRGTRFPLSGAHLTADCEDCHAPSPQGHFTFVNRSSDCVACHLGEYQAAQQPNHPALGFPTDCIQCHTSVAWPQARFNHEGTTFPLTGAHRAVPCPACHSDGVYRGKSSACVSCHQTEYAGTTNPPHGAAQFPTECTACHSTAAWTPATFDHGATAFPLTGAHRTVTCSACHADGVYGGKSTDCVSCHQADYAATTDPGHAAAQFPATCTNCHTTTAWSGATFDHDGPYFPIYSGAHRGRWTSCSTCHTSTASYQQFTCLTCHEHNQTAMDDKHANRSGYSYDSQACYSCHPRGTH
jgi:Zn finger protein HypA/HybF involved in hydrogenase expression